MHTYVRVLHFTRDSIQIQKWMSGEAGPHVHCSCSIQLPSLSARRPIASSKKQGFVTLIKRILILLSLKKLTKIAHLRRGELHTNQLRNALCTEFWIMFKFTSFWNYNFLDFWNDKKMCNHFKKGYKIWAKRGVLQNVRCLLESISQQGN